MQLKFYFENVISCTYCHYNDVTMSARASQITSFMIVYSTIYLGADQRKHQISASLAFVWGIHHWPVNFPHKWPVTRKIFSFDDVIMSTGYLFWCLNLNIPEYKSFPSLLMSWLLMISEAMVLNMQYIWVLSEVGFQLSAPLQWWDIIENTYLFHVF